jgi:riboflavin synthase
MFTGIIEAKARAASVTRHGSGTCVVVEKPRGWKLKKGQSIAVDGICTTVIRSDARTFSLDYMPETLSKTTANGFKKGSVLNLERSLRLDQFVDGHLTQGHVDTRVVVKEVEKKNGKHLVTISVPKSLTRYVALHGSLTLNGVSLTVARLEKNTATAALIPHTITHTNLATIKKGDEVNLEVDLIARYVIHGKRVVE